MKKDKTSENILEIIINKALSRIKKNIKRFWLIFFLLIVYFYSYWGTSIYKDIDFNYKLQFIITILITLQLLWEQKKWKKLKLITSFIVLFFISNFINVGTTYTYHSYQYILLPIFGLIILLKTIWTKREKESLFVDLLQNYISYIMEILIVSIVLNLIVFSHIFGEFTSLGTLYTFLFSFLLFFPDSFYKKTQDIYQWKVKSVLSIIPVFFVIYSLGYNLLEEFILPILIILLFLWTRPSLEKNWEKFTKFLVLTYVIILAEICRESLVRIYYMGLSFNRSIVVIICFLGILFSIIVLSRYKKHCQKVINILIILLSIMILWGMIDRYSSILYKDHNNLLKEYRENTLIRHLDN